MAFVKCCIADCKHAGAFEFRIAIPAVGHPLKPSVTLTTGQATCAAHKSEINVRNLLTEDDRDLVLKHMPVSAPPDFDRAFLEWMKL